MDLETTRLTIEVVMAMLITPFAIVMWFLLRKLISDMAVLEKSMAEIQLQTAMKYVQKEDFVKALDSQKQDFIKALENQKEDFKGLFDAVFKKLDSMENWIRQGKNNSNQN